MEVKKAKKAEKEALKRELEKAKDDLKQVQGDFAEAMLKVAKKEELKEKLGQANGNVVELEDEVEQLKNEVLNAKIDSVAEYKESLEYWMSIGYAVIEFLAKDKIQMKRIL